MQWIVTRTDPSFNGLPPRGPRRAPFGPSEQLIEAETLEVQSGTLVFRNGEDLVVAFNSDGWTSVAPAPVPPTE